MTSRNLPVENNTGAENNESCEPENTLGVNLEDNLEALDSDLHRDQKLSYTRILGRDFGVRGPKSLLKEGAEVTVRMNDGRCRVERVGRMHAYYKDTDCSVHYLIRSDSVPNDRVTYLSYRGVPEGHVLRGPMEMLVEGEWVEVAKLDGNIQTELVGARVDCQDGIAFHEMIRPKSPKN